MLRFDRKQQNSVKQLSLNKKEIFLKIQYLQLNRFNSRLDRTENGITECIFKNTQNEILERKTIKRREEKEMCEMS